MLMLMLITINKCIKNSTKNVCKIYEFPHYFNINLAPGGRLSQSRYEFDYK